MGAVSGEAELFLSVPAQSPTKWGRFAPRGVPAGRPRAVGAAWADASPWSR